MPLRGTLALLIFLVLPPLARATTITVAFGFEDQYQPGRWTPVRVTVSDTQTRAANLELSVPHSGTTAMAIHQQLTLTPGERTYLFYAPLGYSIDEFQAALRDPDTGKRLAVFPPEKNGQENWRNPPQSVTDLIVCCGEGYRFGARVALAYRREGDGETRGADATIANVRPVELPAAAVGFEGVDVLILAGDAAQKLDAAQQQAISDWVRGGGKLVYWPGTQAPDAASVLAKLLPGTYDGPRSVTLAGTELARADLPARFANFTVRPITPGARARHIEWFGPEIVAVDARRGFGQVLMLPIDASVLQFQGQGRDFWQRLFSDAGLCSDDVNSRNSSVIESARDQGLNGALDAIGQIPGTGSFGFGYVATMLGAMMFVVGPVDWFVLKKLGRQPWTWLTTGGWIGLITVVAVYAGSLLRSGELHFHTLSVVDEIDGQAVSRSDALLLYAAQSGNYDVKSDPDQWWEPFGGNNRYRSDLPLAMIDTRQDHRGNVPERMWVDVWNYRFLHGRPSEPGPASIAAELSRSNDGALTGTIRNTSGTACEAVYLRTRDGSQKLTVPLPADGTALDVTGRFAPVSTTELNGPVFQKPAGTRGIIGFAGAQKIASDQIPWGTFGGLASDGAGRIAELQAEEEDVVVLYAKFTADTPPASLEQSGAKVEHTRIVRVVCRAKRG